jgi:hypothetical protein
LECRTLWQSTPADEGGSLGTIAPLFVLHQGQADGRS